MFTFLRENPVLAFMIAIFLFVTIGSLGERLLSDKEGERIHACGNACFPRQMVRYNAAEGCVCTP